ncbi:LysR substrate-binding domain-containing protein [Microbacterium koreense]|uniref:LysR substrate-binding domain-containing protein n=1 Tax=Microbacterium koreense TaxID=323761 RepID=A0ABW2ZR18_9MICO
MSHTDLNQLRTFVVLYELRSVTATADRLHVTQPTVSYTLARLRERFRDDLFRREGHVMVPTTRATELFGPLHEALSRIEAAVDDTAGFEATTYTGELALGLTSIGEQTFLPPIMGALARERANPHVVVKRIDSDEVEDALMRGRIDLAVTVSPIDVSRLWGTRVRSVEYVALASQDHPLADTSPEMFEGRRFVRVSSRGGHVFPLHTLIEHGLMPQVALSVDEYATVPAVLVATDLVVLLPRHVAEVFRGWFPTLQVTELPWPGESSPVTLYTRRESSLSPAQRWLRKLVIDAISSGEFFDDPA